MNAPHNLVMRRTASTVPAFRYDGNEDFRQWQLRSRKKLHELFGWDAFESCAPDLEIEYDRKENGYRELRFTFESEPGYRVPCHLLLPDGVENPPLMICVQGHTFGMHISMGRTRFPNENYTEEEFLKKGRFAIDALEHGCAAVTIEQRGMGECGGDEEGAHCQLHTMGNLLLGRTTIGERVWDISHLIDVLTTEFADCFDAKRIYCVGHSGGGTATFYAACSDERIAAAIPCGAFCTFEASVIGQLHCTCNYIPKIRRYFDMGELSGLIVPRPVLFNAGEHDCIFPIAGVKEAFEETKRLYAHEGVSDRCVLTVGDIPEEIWSVDPYAGHCFYPHEVWENFFALVTK